MLARLLAAVREAAKVGETPQGGGGGPLEPDTTPGASASIGAGVPWLPRGGLPGYASGMSKNMAIGLMGRLDRLKCNGDHLAACDECATAKIGHKKKNAQKSGGNKLNGQHD